MDLLVERCAGLDVAKREVVACVRTPEPGTGGQRRQVVRTFATFSAELEALADWLQAEGVTQVVMEATGQYWKPIWYVLEERGFALLLVNACHVKILPGRKTDVADAAWLCELLECGLLRGSFVPPPAIRRLRDLTRYRKKLVQAHTAETQRVHKTLEDAGIKLDSVAADVLGVSGRAMLAALVAGERDPAVLAALAKGKLRKKLPQLRQALAGRFSEHHALLVELSLGHLEHLEGAIARLDGRVDEVIAPFAVARDRLDTITGVGKRAAETIIAEIGADMRVFPTAAHLASRLRAAARATTSPAASAAPASPPRATAGWARYWSSAPGRPPTPARPTWPPSSGGWPAASAGRRPPAPSATRSWSSPGTCSATTATTTSLVVTGLPAAATTIGTRPTWSSSSRRSATRSPSNPPPRLHDRGFSLQSAGHRLLHRPAAGGDRGLRRRARPGHPAQPPARPRLDRRRPPGQGPTGLRPRAGEDLGVRRAAGG